MQAFSKQLSVAGKDPRVLESEILRLGSVFCTIEAISTWGIDWYRVPTQDNLLHHDEERIRS